MIMSYAVIRRGRSESAGWRESREREHVKVREGTKRTEGLVRRTKGTGG